MLAFIMLAFEYLTIFGILVLTPIDHTWLGATISNSSDTGVYINYINQASTSPLLQNLFAGPSHVARFDSFWILGGLLMKLGASPILSHEILRILTTIFLAFTIYITARSVTNSSRHTQITSWLILTGVSTGWLYTVYLTVTASWTFGSIVPADLGSEFALSSLLLGGAHMILSPALLMLNTRWIWQIITGSKFNLVIPWVFIAYHVSFHPYYIPIYGIVSLLAFFYNRKSKPVFNFLIINSAMLPGAIYYFYLILKDSKLREHHLVTNTLPLDPIWMWLIILLPIIIACIWIIQNKTSKHSDDKNWVWAWLASAIICIILPFPWNRKFTEALLPALTILTLPFWLHIYDNLKPKTDLILKISLIVLLSFPFLHLMQSQFALATDPAWNKYFYTSNQTIHAWNILKNESQESIIISTDMYTNLWTPAHAQKNVWIGHNHETPNFMQRFSEFNTWRKTSSAKIFNDFLKENKITHVLAHDKKYTELFNDNWQIIFQEDNISVWKKID
ncbi:MAG: hypothetical protein P1P90_00150 [Patescibacteria group bacterium]|nr:hypothetical protein [Patescibacteria group bacterium]